jgi:hypothetical protein
MSAAPATDGELIQTTEVAGRGFTVRTGPGFIRTGFF